VSFWFVQFCRLTSSNKNYFYRFLKPNCVVTLT
jgi:hypothetical protein